LTGVIEPWQASQSQFQTEMIDSGSSERQEYPGRTFHRQGGGYHSLEQVSSYRHQSYRLLQAGSNSYWKYHLAHSWTWSVVGVVEANHRLSRQCQGVLISTSITKLIRTHHLHASTPYPSHLYIKAANYRCEYQSHSDQLVKDVKSPSIAIWSSVTLYTKLLVGLGRKPALLDSEHGRTEAVTWLESKS
jgi:hypothetical protein